MENSENYFVKLNSIDVGKHTEKKNGLTYLSWAWAWGEIKKIHPDATYTIYENNSGWNYHTDGNTCWVKTGVTVNGIEHIEYLPVMDYRNQSIPLSKVTSFDVNKAIQRSLTKACARHGLGLYIYAGEDLPENTPTDANITKVNDKAREMLADPVYRCSKCGSLIQPYKGRNGNTVSVEKHVAVSKKQFGKILCLSCAQFEKADRLKENDNA